MRNCFDMEKNPNILNSFLCYLITIKNYSLETIRGYNIDLRGFFKFIKIYYGLTKENEFEKVDITDINIFILNRVSEADICAYLFAISYNANSKVNTRKRKIKSIRVFYSWLSKNNPRIRKNPADSIESITEVYSVPKYLTLESCKRIIDVFNPDNSRYYVRNNLIIRMFLNTGLRVSELSNIKIKDIDIENKNVSIIGKGNKERIVYLNKNLVQKIEEYIKFNYNGTYTINSYLFTSNLHKQLCTRQIENVVNQAYKLGGLENNNYTTHSLRHTYATIMYQHVKNMDILLLKELLGHASISSTEIYMHVDNKQLKDAVNKHPLNNVT